MTIPSIEALLQLGIQKNFVQSPNSRYVAIPVTFLEMPNGEKIVYLRRRFVPAPERFALLEEHSVAEKDRLDNLSAQYLGDPEQFWRLCDANRAMRPNELTETVGRRLRITLPEGIPGNEDA